MQEITATQLVTQIISWLIVLVCFITLMVYNSKLRKEIKYQKEAKKIFKHKLEVAEYWKDVYKDKYLDVVSKITKYNTTADYKNEIIKDYKNKVTCVEMGKKY